MQETPSTDAEVKADETPSSEEKKSDDDNEESKDA